jgi:phage-related protein (TIGR01555 family)
MKKTWNERKSDYKKDAGLLLKDARNRKIKDVGIVSLDHYKTPRLPILPTFTYFQDGFRNMISGLGGAHAKSSYTTYKAHYCITDSVLHALWLNNGLSRKIVNAPADDATKNNINIENDAEHDLLNKFTKLKGIKNINLADKYRKHYGGSLIVVGTGDNNLWEPLNPNSIKSVDWLRTYSRTDVYFTNINFTEDLDSENYGQPEFYTIVPKYTTPFNVHYTRVLEFKGLPVPSELDNDYRYYWGMSVIEPLWETLKKNGASLDHLDQLLYEVTISIYKIKDLAKLMCEKKWDTIKEILNQTDLAKSTINSMIIDSEDDYKRDTVNFSGIKDIFEILMMYLTGESEVPMIRLFGKQSGGLNNEGEAELRTYYDNVKAHQENDLTEPTQKLIDIINMSKEFNNKIKDPIVSYNSPWQLTQKEELENRELQSKIDHQQIEDNIITPEQVAENRIIEGYSYEMGIDRYEEIETEVIVPEEDNEIEE